ncbi:TatD family hydrolase [Siminovitchia sediminis]|uniref:TatD family hydrolase n=1 Tax=Siminovitchia sediminis TaxID=1274353 RepID=A0ABW4KFE7_9BACI
MKPIIDAHIHLDLYEAAEIEEIMAGLENAQCTDVISVSYHLDSCRINLQLAETYHQVRPAFGFHPEQELPSDHEISQLFSWMENHAEDMVAVGEVGLPYYMRMEQGAGFSLQGYMELLEEFIKGAKRWNKPIVLHAVYDDAPAACDLLEKHGVKKAHFHWFKGDAPTTERIAENGWFISVTPDVLYEQEIRGLVQRYPLKQMMVETDGPWRFEGIFSGKMTHPRMIHQSVDQISSIKGCPPEAVYQTLYANTKEFYRLNGR